MNTITAIKTVKMSGSSKAIYVTSELNLLGDIQVGDKIEITLKKIDWSVHKRSDTQIDPSNRQPFAHLDCHTTTLHKRLFNYFQSLGTSP